MMNMTKQPVVVIGEGDLSLDQIIDVAKGRASVKISSDPAFAEKIAHSKKLLLNAMETGVPVYGVTTGYGKSCGKRMAMEVALKNGGNLLRFHGCGTGEPLGIEETRAAILTRILCFSRGFSCVSMDLISQMAAFLNEGITPVVPSEGSVGASGDLTPMCYVAAALAGEREVFYRGRRMPAEEALKLAGLPRYVFGPKEPLAIINGTSTMTGIACVVLHRTRRIINAALAATCLTIHGMKGNAHHYHPTISKAKPHPGQALVARRILRLLDATIPHGELEADELETLQDPYSIRCCPQILGVLVDALDWIVRWIEIEANSNNDNPLCDPETGEVLMGGNFYGGHVVFAMDSLKAALASVADMCDRQVQLLVNPNVNRGLPADLVRVTGDDRLYNHGFKAMSISASALAAEALKAAMPAAVFSRSTESHNQDKVSMGTIGARDAARICQLVERTLAIHLLTAAQACDIRGKVECRPSLKKMYDEVRSIAGPNLQDRPMDSDIELLAAAIKEKNIFMSADE